MFARALNTLSALKRKPPQRPGRRRPVVEGMEPRILFSADGLAALMAPMDAGIHTLEHVIEQVIAQVTDAPALVLPHPSAITTDASVHAGAEAPTVDASPHEIVVIDSRVANYQQLIDDIRARNGNSANIEIIVLNQIVNGIEQVTQLLAGQHGISALHIVSHGVDGGVQLGEGLVDTAVLQREATALAQWRNALNGNADILVYGCDVAAGSAGQLFVADLARLTGADVAASTNVTGSAALGGDWVLEDQVGIINTPTLLDGDAQGAWSGTLANAAPTLVSWFNTAWDFRKEIVLDHNKVAANQTNFPVLVSLGADANLQAHALANGNDILFTAADGVTKLDHQIERYSSVNGQLVAWVRIPALSAATDTTIYMYYGDAAAANQQNATAVWDANTVAVYHLDRRAHV